ncbi:hypothetical protein PV350_00540 [Streptomyces sp. PA03-6a]|nr:hypothetical protein [Streptomyces sp. PA03-6a]
MGDTFSGNTRGADGTVHYDLWWSCPSRAGVWKLAPGSRTARRIAALPADGLPNGRAVDPGGRTLYVADSRKGTIWAVPTAGGKALPWLTDPALAPLPDAGRPFGANGLRFPFLGDRSNVVPAAVNAANRVDVIYPDGTRATVLTAADGLASPTATALRGTTLYVTDAGVQEPHQAQVQGARIHPRALRHITG